MTTRRPLVLAGGGQAEMPTGDLLPGDLIAPAWTAGTAYGVGALVWQSGVLYRRKTAGTSGASFDPSTWDSVGGESDAWLGVLAVTADPMTDNVFGNARTYYARITRGPLAMTISKVGLLVGGVSAGNIGVAVHRSTGSGAAATPGDQVAVSSQVACPTANTYSEVALSSSVSAGRGDWLALSTDTNTARFGSQAISAFPINDFLARQGSGTCPTTPAALASTLRRPILLGVA